MKKLIAVMAVVLFAGITLNAQEPKQLAEQFLITLNSGNVDAAYALILKGSQIQKQKPQAVVFLKKQTGAIFSLYGQPIGIEFVKSESFGNSVVRLLYIQKTKMLPVVWEFFFYKPYNNWLLINIKFNDKTDMLLK